MAPFDLSRVGFHRPDLLWLLAGALLFLLVRARAASGLAGGERVRSFLAMWARIAAYAALVVAAAGPYTIEDRPDLAVAVVVDGSGSSAGGRLQAYLRRAREIGDALLRADEASAPVFVSLGGDGSGRGAAVRRHRDPEEMEASLRLAPDGAGTDLRPAIEEAIRALPRARTRRVVLLTDGAQTRGSLERVAALASARDVRLYPMPPDDGRLSVSVLGLQADQDARVGDEIAVHVELHANAEAEGRLLLRGPEDRILARMEPLRVRPGTNRASLRFAAPDRPGLIPVRAEIAFEGDLFRSDDAAPGLIRVAGPPWALLVGDAAAAGPLREALAGANPPIEVEAAPAGRLPPYDGYDLVALLDPDLPALGARGAEALREWVRRGGRLLLTGGENGLVVDRPGLEPVAELLPVRFPRTEREEPAPLAVVYCIDRSDSMARYGKFEIALSAVAASLDLVQPESEVGVLTFSDFPRWAVPLTEASRKEEIVERLTELQIHGGTSIFPALEAAYEALRKSDALVKHVILLTDGRSTTVYERHGAVVDTLRNAGITLSTVAISREADTAELQRIAEVGGGRYYYTEDFRSIPRIVMDETMKVMRTNKVDETFRVHAVPGSRFLSGIDVGRIPVLRGYVRSRQKAGSELALATERGEPVLVGWRFGRGAVTVFTSDVAGPWSAPWRGWSQAAVLWRQVVRQTLAPPPPPRISLVAEARDQEARVVYSALDPLGAPLNDLRVEGRVHTGAGEAVLAFEAIGPGRYGATFPLPEGEGAALVHAAASGKGASVLSGGEVSVSVAPEPPEEALGGTLNPGALEHLASATGGKVAPEVAELLSEGVEKREVEVDRFRPFLWAGFALLLLDLTIRRLRWPARG